MSKKKQIQKSNPDNEDAINLAEQFDTVHDLKALYDTEGGKQLVTLLLSDVTTAVYKIAAQRRELSLQDFQSLASDIDTKLNLAKLLINAKENEEFLEEQIQEALT